MCVHAIYIFINHQFFDSLNNNLLMDTDQTSRGRTYKDHSHREGKGGLYGNGTTIPFSAYQVVRMLTITIYSDSFHYYSTKRTRLQIWVFIHNGSEQPSHSTLLHGCLTSCMSRSLRSSHFQKKWQGNAYRRTGVISKMVGCWKSMYVYSFHSIYGFYSRWCWRPRSRYYSWMH